MLGTTWGEALYNPVCMIAAGVCWELHFVQLLCSLQHIHISTVNSVACTKVTCFSVAAQYMELLESVRV